MAASNDVTAYSSVQPDWSPIPFYPIQPRQKPMEVLCLGLSRTGTMSTWVAMGMLGLNCYHCAERGRNETNNHVLVPWREAIEAKYFGGKRKKLVTRADFDEVLWRYQAITDIPCVLFADELLNAYPEAKVVLTERDVDGWTQSVRNSFVEILSWRVWYFLRIFDGHWARNYIPILSWPLHIWSGGHPNDMNKLAQGYLAHNRHIRDVVPKDRLLVWHPRDGWEPLCGSLDKPVPAHPFPRINEGDYVTKLFTFVLTMRVIGVVKGWAKVALPAGVAGGACWWFGGQQVLGSIA